VVHREGVEARGREMGHPAVVRARRVERHRGGRARAVDEEHHAVAGAGAARDRVGLCALANVDPRALPGDLRDGRARVDVVIDRHEALVVPGGRRVRAAGNG
jgi:hypothetical protein